MNKAKYYVYAHLKPDSGEVFYIGKGTRYRAYKLKNRNAYHKNIVRKHGIKILIVRDCLTEKQALNLEVRLISKYKKLGLCQANLTSGGETVVFSKEVIKRISDTQRSKGPLKANHRKNIGLSQRGTGCYTKKILKYPNRANKRSKSYVDPNGVIFLNSDDAAFAHKISASTVRAWSRRRLNGWKSIKRR